MVQHRRLLHLALIRLCGIGYAECSPPTVPPGAMMAVRNGEVLETKTGERTSNGQCALRIREGTVDKFLLLGLLLVTPVLAQDQAADLRTEAGCGPAKTKFDVKVDKKQHVVTQPEAGKALVYVFEEYQSDPRYPPIGHLTTRVGLDGKWVGATH